MTIQECSSIRILVESRLCVQRMIEIQNNYQGITLDESMALRQLFNKKREDLVAKEQFSELLEESKK